MEGFNPYAPPAASVLDVHDPTAALVLADRGSRLGAAILDALIIGCMWYGPFLVGVGLDGALGVGDGTFAAVGGLLALAGFIVWAWLTIQYVRRNGQSIAKKLLAIKVVRTDGSPISLGRLFWLRNVVNALLGIIPFYGIVDALFIFGETRQCLHDKLADTMVVKA